MQKNRRKICNFATDSLDIAQMKDQKQEKTETYRLLTEQIRTLIEGETDIIAVMANVCAAIHETMGFF